PDVRFALGLAAPELRSGSRAGVAGGSSDTVDAGDGFGEPSFEVLGGDCLREIEGEARTLTGLQFFGKLPDFAGREAELTEGRLLEATFGGAQGRTIDSNEPSERFELHVAHAFAAHVVVDPGLVA